MEARSKYRILLILALGLWLIGGTWAQAQEHFEIPGFTMEDIEIYGNCATITRVDMLTDEESPVLMCWGQAPIFPNIVLAANHVGRYDVRLAFHGDKSPYSETFIDVTLRIDKGPIISRTAYWNSTTRFAEIPDPALARSLLNELAAGMRVVFRMGLTQGHIDLHGSALAIADFRSRLRP